MSEMNEGAAVYTAQITSFITTIESHLQELSRAQSDLLEKISEISTITAAEEEKINTIKQNMSKVSAYNTKLLSLKATMSMLSGRSKQLIERSNKLKQMKLKYLSQIDDIRRIEQEKDLVIAAKPAIISTPSPSTSSPITLQSRTPEANETGNESPSTASPVGTPVTTSAAVPTVIPKVKSIVKKKKKSKVREALIDDNNSSNWAIPKKSLSQKDLTAIKK